MPDMLPPETLGTDAERAERRAALAELITVPDVDTLEARVARIESMVSDIHATVSKIEPITSAISREMAEKGPVGMLGYLMSAMRPNG